MIGVIFELEPKQSKKDQYFKIAKKLKPTLENIEGFISIERFQSVNNPERYLSLSFWKDEKAVMAWRNQSEHRQAQEMGRASIFNDYRLRVVSVIRDYGMTEREQAPVDALDKTRKSFIKHTPIN